MHEPEFQETFHRYLRGEMPPEEGAEFRAQLLGEFEGAHELSADLPLLEQALALLKEDYIRQMLDAWERGENRQTT